MYYGFDWSKAPKSLEMLDRAHKSLASGIGAERGQVNLAQLVLCIKVCNALHGVFPRESGGVVRFSAPWLMHQTYPQLEALLGALRQKQEIVRKSAQSASTVGADAAADAVHDSVGLLVRLAAASFEIGMDLATSIPSEQGYEIGQAMAAQLDKSKIKAGFKVTKKPPKKPKTDSSDEDTR